MMKRGLAMLLAGCATTPVKAQNAEQRAPEVVVVPAADPQAELRAVVRSFITATEERRFDQVRALLARPLRERYSVERLRRDFGDDPLATERLTQLKLKSSAPLIEAKGSASLEWSSGRSLRLVHEAEGWRIAALE